MRTHVALKFLLVGTVATILTVVVSFMQVDRSSENDASAALKVPPFLASVHAQDALNLTSIIGSILDSEAGISAYFKAPDGITLSQVRGLFRTIEAETNEYIIGSVPVPNYPEHFDVHVYVNQSGWVLAYYLRDAPVSKIVDIVGNTINTTKLKSVLFTFAAVAGTPLNDVTYYDFRYPNATNMLFVSQDHGGGNTFTILPPGAYAYSEFSWASTQYGLTVDGFGPLNMSPWGNNKYGSLTTSQLLPETTHTVAIGSPGYGVLVIVYRVP